MSSGTARWKHVYRRLLRMDRAEIAERFRQQTMARLDFLRYRVAPPLPVLNNTSSSAPVHFFFSPDAVPDLCTRLRELFPETVEQIIQRAERICRHRFDLLGYDALDYGLDIDWHCDRVNGKRAPRKPWFQVRYLDFAEVGDSKIAWELSRHQHFVTLAKAYRLSNDSKFTSELFRQWHHWHAENRYPIGINWASSLEVAFRSFSWLWMYHLLAGSPVVSSAFRSDWLRALAISGRHIDTYLSTYFSPNTHLLGEAVALFFIGTLCPEIPSARAWQERGWKIVQQEAKRQVRSDGFHFEQSTYYHVYALDFFLHSAILASLNGVEVPKEFDRTIERMLEALVVLARCGGAPRLGDDDGGRLFDPSRNRAPHLLDPVATGAVLFARGDFKTLAGGPREEMLWLLGKSGLSEFERIPTSKVGFNSAAFRESGLYVMAGENQEWQVVIDAGPQGAHTAGHGHADALSITASRKGADLLIDSGTFQYVGVERDRFRGTQAHNTLMIAGEDQADPRGPFGWETLPNIQAEGWIAGKTFDLFVGSHDGYSRLPNPVVHRRFVFAHKSGIWLVRDIAVGSGEHQLDLFWHVGPQFRTPHSDADFFSDGLGGLRFVTVEGNGWSRSIEDHEHSPVYGKKENHSMLHFATKAHLPAEFVTLMSVRANAGTQHRLTKIESQSSVTGYRCQTEKDEHCIFFGPGGPWKSDSWRSDAEFLYWGRAGEQEGGSSLICCNATFVDWQGRRIVTARRPALRCEIIGSETSEVVSSDPEGVAVDLEGWKTLSNRPQLVLKTE